MRGRPFLFLGAVVSVWVGARIAVLWPAAEAILTQVPLLAADASRQPVGEVAVAKPVAPTTVSHLHFGARSRAARFAAKDSTRTQPPMTDAQILAAVGVFYFTEVPAADPGIASKSTMAQAPGSALALPSPRPAAAQPRRWSLDAWSLMRPGPANGSFGPQLGGSQAGVRLGYFLDRKRRAAAYARVTTPLEQDGVEAALGVQWQPTRLPVAAFAEARRRAGGQIVPVAGVVGGVYRSPIAAGWRLDGYGQAGVVGTKRIEGFADGQARVTHPLGGVGPGALEAGLGTWGGIQRGAARFDLGPTLGLDLPVRSGNLRLTLDWRQRVVGHAAPASGPALTLAAGF